MENQEILILKRLSSLDKSQREEFQPDIRGWNVLGQKGYKLGIVSDLWIDMDEMAIRYTEVDTEFNQRVLIPIGLIALNTKEQFVVAVDLKKDELPNLPPFEGDKVTRDYETKLRTSYLPKGTTSVNAADFYNHSIFDERSLFGVRSTRKKMKTGYIENINQKR
jgi:sporulation protein YlmC with PRC-barrel domain